MVNNLQLLQYVFINRYALTCVKTSNGIKSPQEVPKSKNVRVHFFTQNPPKLFMLFNFPVANKRHCKNNISEISLRQFTKTSPALAVNDHNKS